MGSFTRRARRFSAPVFDPGGGAAGAVVDGQFQVNPLAYIQAVRAGLYPYDGTPLSETPPEACAGPPPGLKWCATCERGFGPVESGLTVFEQHQEGPPVHPAVVRAGLGERND